MPQVKRRDAARGADPIRRADQSGLPSALEGRGMQPLIRMEGIVKRFGAKPTVVVRAATR